MSSSLLRQPQLQTVSSLNQDDAPKAIHLVILDWRFQDCIQESNINILADVFSEVLIEFLDYLDGIGSRSETQFEIVLLLVHGYDEGSNIPLLEILIDTRCIKNYVSHEVSEVVRRSLFQNVVSPSLEFDDLAESVSNYIACHETSSNLVVDIIGGCYKSPEKVISALNNIGCDEFAFSVIVAEDSVLQASQSFVDTINIHADTANATLYQATAENISFIFRDILGAWIENQGKIYLDVDHVVKFVARQRFIPFGITKKMPSRVVFQVSPVKELFCMERCPQESMETDVCGGICYILYPSSSSTEIEDEESKFHSLRQLLNQENQVLVVFSKVGPLRKHYVMEAGRSCILLKEMWGVSESVIPPPVVLGENRILPEFYNWTLEKIPVRSYNALNFSSYLHDGVECYRRRGSGGSGSSSVVTESGKKKRFRALDY